MNKSRQCIAGKNKLTRNGRVRFRITNFEVGLRFVSLALGKFSIKLSNNAPVGKMHCVGRIYTQFLVYKFARKGEVL